MPISQQEGKKLNFYEEEKPVDRFEQGYGWNSVNKALPS
jgi:hypothetical protein